MTDDVVELDDANEEVGGLADDVVIDEGLGLVPSLVDVLDDFGPDKEVETDVEAEFIADVDSLGSATVTATGSNETSTCPTWTPPRYRIASLYLFRTPSSSLCII